jgi:hypothetical protein
MYSIHPEVRFAICGISYVVMLLLHAGSAGSVFVHIMGLATAGLVAVLILLPVLFRGSCMQRWIAAILLPYPAAVILKSLAIYAAVT